MVDVKAGQSSHIGTSDGRMHRLVVAGSNARGQLGLGHDDDAHVFTPALCLPAGTEQPVAFPPPGLFIAAIDSGANHSLAILTSSSEPEERQLWACGSNDEAQLGSSIGCSGALYWTQLDLSNETARLSKSRKLRPALVACGWTASFVVLTGEDEDDDVLLSLGSSNDFGELGCGKSAAAQTGASRLLELSSSESSASSKAPMRIRRLASGVRHTCALVSRNEADHVVWQLFGWGAARRGQIGALPESEKTAKRAESVHWTPRCFATWRAPRSASADAASLEDAAAIHLAVGKEHTMLAYPADWQNAQDLRNSRVSSSFVVEAWGSHAKGACDLSTHLASQTTSEEQYAQLLGLDCTWNGTLAVIASPSGTLSVLSSGTNDKGQSGAGYFGSEPPEQRSEGADSEPRPARPDGTSGLVRRAFTIWPASGDGMWQLACGSEHVAAYAARTSHGVWAWGWNEHGNLGTGSADGTAELRDECIPRQIWKPEGPETRLQNVWAGCGTTFIQSSELAP